ncbi:MAG: translation initiation factor IF-2 N-terminal domain-containing protein, partial [Desulfitobacterium hafniense]
MSIRVHELAKELNLSSKEVMSRLESIGVDVKNHLSAVEDQDANRLRTRIQKPQGKEQAAEPRKSVPSQESKNLTQGPAEGNRDKSQGLQVESSRVEGEGRPQGQRPMGDRPQGQRPMGDRPQGQRPMGDRPQGQRPMGDRPQGQRPMGDRPQGQRPMGDRPQGQRPMGDRPQGQRPMGDRPQGQRPMGDR